MNTSKQSKGTIIVFGIAFFYPLAGVTFQFLHYLLGLKKLGYDVYYVEDSERLVYDPTINDLSQDAATNVKAIAKILERYGFKDRWAYRSHYGNRPCYGLTEQQINELYQRADAFLNVTGAQEIRDEHRVIPRRLYIESDPFAAQIHVAQGDEYWLNLLDAHTDHFSFGENLGQPDCPLPTERYLWKPTRQPVALDLWADSSEIGGSQYNTITTWSNKNNDVEWNGEVYHWTKNYAFEKMIDLPGRRPELSFGMAVKAGDQVKQRLTEYSWKLADSVAVSNDVKRYQDYIKQSRGEFTVARDQYVKGRTGWQSDRSVCYLAAGRPVVTQDTAFGKYVPTGEGLFAFADMDAALAAFDAIESDYPRHCKAARELANEYLDAEKVVASIMQRAGL